MKVFISWSGTRSKAVAEALSTWLEKVIQAVEPWISTDIEKGVRWSAEIADRLEKSKVGVFCLTPENTAAPWILFEAGALSKTKDAHVCTLLLDLQAADVKPPLGQFQHTNRDKDDIRRLLKTINDKVTQSGERALTESLLDELFEKFWPDLSAQLERIAKENVAGGKPKPRTDREILEEVLEVVRSQDRRSEEYLRAISMELASQSERTRYDLERYMTRPAGPPGSIARLIYGHGQAARDLKLAIDEPPSGTPSKEHEDKKK